MPAINDSQVPTGKCRQSAWICRHANFLYQLLNMSRTVSNLSRLSLGPKRRHDLRHVYLALTLNQRLRHEESTVDVRRVRHKRAVTAFGWLELPKAVNFLESAAHAVPLEGFWRILFQFDCVFVSADRSAGGNRVLEHLSRPMVGYDVTFFKLRKDFGGVGVVSENLPNGFGLGLNRFFDDAEGFAVDDLFSHPLRPGIDRFGYCRRSCHDWLQEQRGTKEPAEKFSSRRLGDKFH